MLQPPGASRQRTVQANRRKTQESPDEIVRKLQRLPANKKCCDCSSKLPSCVNLAVGSFVCITCSGIHRELNQRVKSVGHSSFTAEEADFLQTTDNDKINAVYLADLDSRSDRLKQPADNSDEHLLRSWIIRKYRDRTWYRDNGGAAPPRQHQQERGPPQPTMVQIPPKQAPAVDLFGGFGGESPSNSKHQPNQQWDAFGGQQQADFADFGNQNQQQRSPQKQDPFPADFGSSHLKQQFGQPSIQAPQQPQSQQNQGHAIFHANFDQQPSQQQLPPQQQQGFANFSTSFDHNPSQQQIQPVQPQGFANFNDNNFDHQTNVQQGFANFNTQSQVLPSQHVQHPYPQSSQLQGMPSPQIHSHTQGVAQFPLQGMQQQSFPVAQQQVPPPSQQQGLPLQQQLPSPPQQQPTNFPVPQQLPHPPQQQQQLPPYVQQNAQQGIPGVQYGAQPGQQLAVNNLANQHQPPLMPGTSQRQQQQQHFVSLQKQENQQGQGQQHLQPPTLQHPPPQSEPVQLQSVDDAFAHLSVQADTKSQEASSQSNEKASTIGQSTVTAPNKPGIPSKFRYAAGQKVYYKSASYCGTAEIVKVHLDDELVPFYTIKVQDKEKQTDEGHLAEESPLLTEVKSMLSDLTDEHLSRLKQFISTQLHGSSEIATTANGAAGASNPYQQPSAMTEEVKSLPSQGRAPSLVNHQMLSSQQMAMPNQGFGVTTSPSMPQLSLEPKQQQPVVQPPTAQQYNHHQAVRIVAGSPGQAQQQPAPQFQQAQPQLPIHAQQQATNLQPGLVGTSPKNTGGFAGIPSPPAMPKESVPRPGIAVHPPFSSEQMGMQPQQFQHAPAPVSGPPLGTYNLQQHQPSTQQNSTMQTRDLQNSAPLSPKGNPFDMY